MAPWAWIATALAGAGVLLHAAAAGCGSDDTSGAGAEKSDGGSTGAGGSGAAGGTTSTTSSSGGGGSNCPPLAPPAVVPEGWVEYGDWSCSCRFYVPGSTDVLPPPIAWEPCATAPAGIDCRAIDVTWTEESLAVGLAPRFRHEPGGQEMLMYRQIAPTHTLDVIAELDGPVHFGMITPFPPGKGPGTANGCAAMAADIDGGRFLFGVLGHAPKGDENDSLHEGALAGSLGSLTPHVFQRFEDENNYSWYMSGDLVVRGTWPSYAWHALPWDLSSETLITSPVVDPEGMLTYQLIVSGSAVFFPTDSSSRQGINVWTAAEGARPFIRFMGESSRGAGDLGTDGIDLVWAYGEDRPPGELVFPVRSVMTAPFTTDPVALEPRRLRSQPDKSIGLYPYIVACGYAAHRGDGNNTVVVRLADGVAWEVPLVFPDFRPSRPIGLTCEEVIILGRFGEHETIARVRLDSLGPGVPPD